MRLTDLRCDLDAPKSSTQRLLEHLADEGWVEQDEETGHYRLTSRLAVLGQRYLQSAGIADSTRRSARTPGAADRRAGAADRRSTASGWSGSARRRARRPGCVTSRRWDGRSCPMRPRTARPGWRRFRRRGGGDRACGRARASAKTPGDVGPKVAPFADGLRRRSAWPRKRGYAIAGRGSRARASPRSRSRSATPAAASARHDQRRRAGRRASRPSATPASCGRCGRPRAICALGLAGCQAGRSPARAEGAATDARGIEHPRRPQGLRRRSDRRGRSRSTTSISISSRASSSRSSALRAAASRPCCG